MLNDANENAGVVDADPNTNPFDDVPNENVDEEFPVPKLNSDPVEEEDDEEEEEDADEAAEVVGAPNENKLGVVDVGAWEVVAVEGRADTAAPPGF